MSGGGILSRRARATVCGTPGREPERALLLALPPCTDVDVARAPVASMPQPELILGWSPFFSGLLGSTLFAACCDSHSVAAVQRGGSHRRRLPHKKAKP